jgi:SAM-dependent methyltransferase
VSRQIRDANWEYGELSARVYELDKPAGRSLHGDVEFYSEALAGLDGEVLEPAVGTGRILVPLVRNGIRVIGFDTSEHMLRICRENLAAAEVEADIFVADMTEYRDPGRFAAAVVAIGSIVLMRDREAVVAALRNLRESLRPGGECYVDVVPPTSFADKGGLRHWWDGERELLTLQAMHVDVDHAAQRVRRWLRYELWRDGRLVDTQVQISVLLCFGVREFEQLMREAGFEDVVVFADYDREAEPTEQAGIWTYHATRPA